MSRARPTALRVTLTPDDRATLQAWQRAFTMRSGLARRARIILLLADGLTATQVARTVGMGRRFVYKWAKRFLAHGTSGLRDQPRGSTGIRKREERTMPDDTARWANDCPVDAEACPWCGEPACERSCASALLADQAAACARLHARAERLYTAYVYGLGPLGEGMLRWHDLLDRQQCAWHWVVRASEETP